MDVKTARGVRAGATVSYEHKLYVVRAVLDEGLWAPFFELDDIGAVSYSLVEVPEGGARQAARGRPEKVLATV
jgi:hypothetical protein